MKRRVAILMGSDSDLPKVQPGIDLLKEFGISPFVEILSAHRSPQATHAFVKKAPSEGVQVFIACAGGAAHLAGVVASLTPLPVIGLPIETSNFKGIDSLLSTLQMPSGVPVATVSFGKAGAINAALLATQIVAIHDEALQKKLILYKKDLEKKVLLKNKKVKEDLRLV
jgi:5-(carboxyamino)imidazole ribonucleotide mutase